MKPSPTAIQALLQCGLLLNMCHPGTLPVKTFSWLQADRAPLSTMPPFQGNCSALPSTSKGLCQHFSSPCKVWNPKKTQTLISIPGQNLKHQCLLAELNKLLIQWIAQSPSNPSTPQCSANDHDLPPNDNAPLEYKEFDKPFECELQDETQSVDSPSLQSKTPTIRHTTSNHNIMINQFTKWKDTIPTLIVPYLDYLENMLRKPAPSVAPTISYCWAGCCEMKEAILLTLFHNHKFVFIVLSLTNIWHSTDFSTITVRSCSCATLPQVLLYHGLFPTAPSLPWMMVSVKLLAFYWALFEHWILRQCCQWIGYCL